MCSNVSINAHTGTHLPRVGVAGLGSIAQKAYLPILSQAARWRLVGAFSPDEEKTRRLCRQYRIDAFPRLASLAAACDAVFVHSSTASHFEVVSALLRAGVDVYVDKPLAETRHRNLMVGFNRRFAPLYRQLKSQLTTPASVRVEKHRLDDIGPHGARFTLLDDYLHVIDTAQWLSGGTLALRSGTLQRNPAGQLCYAEHHFTAADVQITTAMHRRAGSQRETVQAIQPGAIYQVDDLRDWRQETQGVITRQPAPSWRTMLEQRGFVGAVDHFIDSLERRSPPETSGEQGIAAQRMVEAILRAEGL